MVDVKNPETNMLQQDGEALRYNQDARLAATVTIHDNGFLVQIEKEQQADEQIQKWEPTEGYQSEVNGVLLWNGSFMVPK
jgi:hypothetical protein